MKKRNRGFTLVEMVVIISIFVILLGIMVPSLNSILGFRVQRAANSIASALDKTKIEASNRLVGEMMLERREDGYYISYIIDRGKVNGKENIKVSDATTSHLRVTNNHIYFENNRDNIYSLSLLTKEIKNVYEGSNCYFFETDGKYIYLSDYQNDNTILKLDAHTFEEKGRINIRTVNFCIYNGSLCYIPFVDEDDIGDNYKDYSHIYNEEGQIIL